MHGIDMAPTFDERIDDAIARGHADAVAAWEIRQKGLMDEVQEMEIAWGKLYEEQNEERTKNYNKTIHVNN